MNRKNGLDGLTGVVLLMFTGRVTYTSEFSKELTPRFYHRIENVDQAVARLDKEGYILTELREVVERGAPKYRTASSTALKMQLDLIKKHSGKAYTEQLLKDLSVIAPYFPEYLEITHEAGQVTKLPWNIIYGNYLTLGLQVLGLLLSEEKTNDVKELELEILTPAIKALECMNTETRKNLLSRYDLEDISKLTKASMVLIIGKNGPRMFKQMAKMMGADFLIP